MIFLPSYRLMLKSIDRASREVISMGPLTLQRAAKAGWGHHPETARTRRTVWIKGLLLWFVCTCVCTSQCTYISVAMGYGPRHLAKVGQTPGRTELTVNKQRERNTQTYTAYMDVSIPGFIHTSTCTQSVPELGFRKVISFLQAGDQICRERRKTGSHFPTRDFIDYLQRD